VARSHPLWEIDRKDLIFGTPGKMVVSHGGGETFLNNSKAREDEPKRYLGRVIP